MHEKLIEKMGNAGYIQYCKANEMFKFKSRWTCISEAMLSVILDNIGEVARPCPSCLGLGDNPDVFCKICNTCHGTGVIVKRGQE